MADKLILDFSVFPTIETDRLLLRAITQEDAAALFELRTNKDVLMFLDRDPMKSIEETSEFIQTILAAQARNESIAWTITLKDDPAMLIGNISLWRIIPQHFRAEVGYMLHPNHWHKGIMKEALLAVIHYAFHQTELHSLEANINPENIASGSLLKSCGFVQEAYFRGNYFYNGVFGDSIIFSLINTVSRV